MFMHKSKKGFTIVELVIVIAVIAILAAVLIPTFSNLVKKANISADQQAVRQMNTALAMESKISSNEEMIAALSKAGYNSEKILLPVTKDYYFYYISSEKIVVLVDENQKVAYPENAKCYGSTVPAGSYNLVIGLNSVIPTDGEALVNAVATVGTTKNIGIVGSVTTDKSLDIDVMRTFYAQAGSSLTTPSIVAEKDVTLIGESGTFNTTFVVGGDGWEMRTVTVRPNPNGNNRITLKNDSGDALFVMNDNAAAILYNTDIVLKDGQKLVSFNVNSYYGIDIETSCTINGVAVSELTDAQWAQYVDLADGGCLDVNGTGLIGLYSYPQ